MSRPRIAIALAAVAVAAMAAGLYLRSSKKRNTNDLNDSKAAAVTCPQQGVQPGVYYVISQSNPDEPCLDKDTNDGLRIQFYFCNGDFSQKFQFATGLTQGSACYAINDYKGLLGVGAPDDESNIVALGFAPMYAAWWSVQSSDNGAHAIIHCVKNCGRVPPGCLDRRTPDNDRQAQIIECRGVPTQTFTLQKTE